MNKNDNSLTPMMKQYQEMKKRIPGAILLFRLGDFYEMFYDDAKVASGVLEIALTSREGGQNGRYPMCGFPYHAAAAYIPKLVKAGHKLAICEQVEDPKTAKGIVKREITKVITPGTAIDENLVSDKQSNYLVAINRCKTSYGIALVELSTGEFKVTQVYNDHDLFSELFRVRPKEFVVPEYLQSDKVFLKTLSDNCPTATINPYSEWIFEAHSAQTFLREFLGTYTLEGYGIEDNSPVIGAAAGALHYLKDNLYTAIEHINTINHYSLNDYMIIDPISQRNLELLEPLRVGSASNTLFSILDFTSTPMGGRLFKSWLTSPLIEKEKIHARQDGVAQLVENKQVITTLSTYLKRVRDLERIISRCGLKQVSTRDMVVLRESLKQIPFLKEILKDFNSLLLSSINEGLKDLPSVVQLLDSAIVDEPPVTLKDGGVIKEGYDTELDEIRNISIHGQQWMADLQQKEIERTGIKSLKVRYNKVFGYYIEITRTNLNMVPDHYIRKQTLVSAERFITTELKDMESKLFNAEERMRDIESELFEQVRQTVVSYTGLIQETAHNCALLDCIVSLSNAAIHYNYVRPDIADDDLISIRGGRHPVVEALLDKGEFVPNDLLIDTETNQLLIITGPNMAGKSTYIRQAALLVILAQIGSFIPAESASIGIVDRIFTRVGASDELSKGQSTFMVEMIETANILNNATSRSLIILDEIGRGTSTFDGISIAWAVAEYLSNTPDVRARTLFATHYHELTELENQLEGVVNYNIAVREWNDKIIFLRKILPGGTDKSYGIHVARLAGLPKKVIERALEILAHLENDCIREQSVIPSPQVQNQFDEQLMLFGHSSVHPVVSRIKDLTCDSITPLEALHILYELKEMVKENG
jgi:DNA mismatch repair protein MutS